MNYILIMTEGPTELAFVNVLLEKKLLKFSKEELLMERIYHSRQISGEILNFIQILPNNDTVDIYRVGDKLQDKLKIPSSILKEKIRNKYDICTLPEFEMLFILNENLYNEYLKNKSIKKPSVFYKEVNKKYNKQAKFVFDYFINMSNENIVSLIDLYVKKHKGAHSKNQYTLKEIIK